MHEETLEELTNQFQKAKTMLLEEGDIATRVEIYEGYTKTFALVMGKNRAVKIPVFGDWSAKDIHAASKLPVVQEA